jgi:hypothetical protein
MAHPRGFIVIDTLAKLRDHNYRLVGYCDACARLYRPDAGPGGSPPYSFAIDLAALIAERGEACAVVGLRPVPCPRCGSRETRSHLAVAPKGG